MMDNNKPYTLEELRGIASTVLTMAKSYVSIENMKYKPHAGIIISDLKSDRPRTTANSGYTTYPTDETYDPYSYMRSTNETGFSTVVDVTDEAIQLYIEHEGDTLIKQQLIEQIVAKLQPILIK